MKRKQFSEEQNIGILKEADAGQAATEAVMKGSRNASDE